MITGIVIALPEEITTLTSQKMAQGEILALGKKVFLVYAGVGPDNAMQAARHLIEKGANRLISWGCAAALSPELEAGDLVVPSQVFFGEEQPFKTDVNWSDRVSKILSDKVVLSRDSLLMSPHLVSDSNTKKTLFRQTGAVALDMESGAVAKVAAEVGLSCIVIRAIADPVNMNLPVVVSRALNDQGQVQLQRLLWLLLLHPWEIPALIKLGLHFNAARKTLSFVSSKLSEIIDR